MTDFNRRSLIAGAAAIAAAPALAATPKGPTADAQKKIRAAIDRQLPENIARIRIGSATPASPPKTGRWKKPAPTPWA